MTAATGPLGWPVAEQGGDRVDATATLPSARFALTSRGGRPVYGALLVAGLLSGPLGFVSSDDATGLLDYWLLPAVLLVGLVVAAELPGPLARLPVTPRAALTCAGIVAAFVAGAVVVEERPVGELAWLGLANALSAAMLAALYRLPTPGRPWVPGRIGDVVAMTAAAAGATLAGLLLGAFPPTPLGGGGEPRVDLWNACWQFSLYVVTASAVLPLLFRRATPILRPVPRRWWPALVVLALACLQLPDLVPTYPVDWVFVVPAVAAGVLMPMRTCAAWLLAMSVWWAVTPYADYPDPPPGQLVAPEAIVDLVLGFVNVVAIVIVVHRERAAVLGAAMRERAEAERAREAMLGAVLASMRDAVLLTDRSGRVLMSNAAAAALAGGAVPDRVTLAWVRQVGLLTREGLAADQAEVDRLVRPEGDRQVLGEVLRVDDSGERRHLVSATPVRTQEGARTLLLMRDVTAEHRRFRRLEWFATSVASDLTEPLTALDRRIEAAIDAVLPLVPTTAAPDATAAPPEASVALVRELLETTQTAVGVMRGSIEDYLVRAVFRDQGPMDRVVDLGAAAAELVAAQGDSGVAIELAGPMTHQVVVDAHLLTQLFANAVTVAVADLVRQPAPRVRLGSRRQEARWVEVTVVAMGAPRDERAPYAAGRPPESLPLALCRATIARHGGRFDLVSGPGRATVRFTLPVAGETP